MLILPFDNLLHPYLQWNTEVYIGLSMHEKCPYRSSFGLYFLDSQDKSPYLVHEMHEKTEQKNSEYGRFLFTQCISYIWWNFFVEKCNSS